MKVSPMITRRLSYALSYLLDQDCQAAISGEGFADKSDLQSTLAVSVHGALKKKNTGISRGAQDRTMMNKEDSI